MEALQARIDSFKKSKRVKNPTKTSSTTTLKWPHPDEFGANPETLAEAGFYYDPSYDDPDNVTCYCCGKQLGGWEEDDDPFDIHWSKCGQTCCWAGVRCGLMKDMDKSGRFVFPDKTRLPGHKHMEKARMETFGMGKGWTHDNVKNHGANSKSMARAGFVYTPQHSGDDLATCLYCTTSLSGWDAEDDPLEEHRTRAAKLDERCPFFDNDVAQTAKPPSKVTATKPPSKPQSKPPSRSTSRTKHQDIILPTKTFDGEEDESDAPGSSTTAQTTTKTPRKPRSTSGSRKSSAKTPRGKARSSSRTGLKNVEEEAEEDVPVEPPATVKKKARTRSKSVARSEATDQTEGDTPLEPPRTAKKKAQSRAKSVPRSEMLDEDDDEGEPAPSRKPSRSRAKSKAPADTEPDEEVQRKSSRRKTKASVAPSVDEDDAPRKPSRTRSKPKVVESEHEEEDEQQPEPVVEKPKPKHHRTASRSKSKAPPQVSDADSVSEKVLTAAPPKRTASRSKPRAPEVHDLFNEEIVMDSYIPQPSSPPPAVDLPPSTSELAPLFIPKRTKTVKAPPALDKEVQDAPLTAKVGRPKAKPKPASNAPSPSPTVDSSVLLAPVSAKPSKPPLSQGTVPAKSKPISKTGNAHGKQKMKVVEVSSDEESDEIESTKDKKARSAIHGEKENSLKTDTLARAPSQPPPEAVSKPQSSDGKIEPKPVVVEPPKVRKPPRSTSPSPDPLVDNNGDISMADHSALEPEINPGMYTAPSTPPRPLPPRPASGIQRPSTPPMDDVRQPMTAEPQFIPPLSKLPFIPLQGLSDAELDMTVEEWIRYQMEVEHDKFRRDGERELEKFKKRAEEVRKVIEGL